MAQSIRKKNGQREKKPNQFMSFVRQVCSCDFLCDCTFCRRWLVLFVFAGKSKSQCSSSLIDTTELHVRNGRGQRYFERQSEPITSIFRSRINDPKTWFQILNCSLKYRVIFGHFSLPCSPRPLSNDWWCKDGTGSGNVLRQVLRNRDAQVSRRQINVWHYEGDARGRCDYRHKRQYIFSIFFCSLLRTKLCYSFDMKWIGSCIIPVILFAIYCFSIRAVGVCLRALFSK